MFARDRKYQRSLQAQQAGRSAAEPADDKDSKAEKRPKSELSDSEHSDMDEDDECKRILESGGRDRCAYFFWQGRFVSNSVPQSVFCTESQCMGSQGWEPMTSIAGETRGGLEI